MKNSSIYDDLKKLLKGLNVKSKHITTKES
jgi:hypothetical protein